jgi:hypothetical protein
MLILEPAIGFIERRRQRIERHCGAALVGREQRLLAHERDLLAQALELRIEQLAPPIGVRMRCAARAYDFELLLETALQIFILLRTAQALDDAPFLLFEIAMLAAGGSDDLENRGAGAA